MNYLLSWGVGLLVATVIGLFTMIVFDILSWTHRRKARTLHRNQ